MKLYTAEELAGILRIHPKTVYRLGREGKLELVRVGRSVRFAEPMVRKDRWAKNGTQVVRE